jgi:hypothetical protein
MTFYDCEKICELDRKTLRGIFVRLGFKVDTIRFGIIISASLRLLSIQTSINNFNEVYLSSSGLSTAMHGELNNIVY